MELAAMDGDLFGDVRRTDGARRGRASPSRLREPLYPPSRTRRSIPSQGSSRRRPHLVTVTIRHIKVFRSQHVRLCLVPKNSPQTPNFPSYLHHIKILNIANDSCMEY